MGNLLIKFAADTELGGVGCSLEGIIRIQNDLEKLSGELDISKMKFSENKCKVLRLRGRNHMYEYRIKNICPGSNVAEKILSIIMDHKLLSRLSAVIAEGHIYSAVYSSFLDKTGEVMFSSSYSTGFGFCWSTWSHFLAWAFGYVGKLWRIQITATKRMKCLENSVKEGKLEKNAFGVEK